MGAGDFHGRVRDGIGCGLPAIATRLSNPPILAPCGRWEGCGSGAVLGVCLPRCPGRLPSGLSRGCAERGLWMISMHDGVLFEPIGRLGPVSCARCRASTPGLST